jgi:hypothetical protein
MPILFFGFAPARRSCVVQAAHYIKGILSDVIRVVQKVDAQTDA